MYKVPSCNSVKCGEPIKLAPFSFQEIDMTKKGNDNGSKNKIGFIFILHIPADRVLNVEN